MASAWQVDVWQYAQDYAPTVEALGGAASAMLFSHTVPMLALLFGAVLGLLLPRPKWLSGSRSSAVLVTALPGLRSFALSVQALFIIREVWTHFTYPGTFRGLVQSTAAWCTGRGWTFSWPTSFATNSTAAPAAKAVDTIVQAEPQEQTDNWYVGEKDVAFFRYHAIDNGVEPGATPWEIMMDKNIPNFLRYTAWRRTLPSGKTEYKSTTIAPDVTAEEFMDMYLDDAFRHNWDGMVIHHEVLEHGDFSKRDLVVRWIRRFPFAFLSDREYTIARRCFCEPDGSLIAITKALAGHPREATDSNVVKMDVFWSMWRSVNVACPWGSGKPATETTLLHHEQFKIPENLARFAVRHGMWGFLRTLGQQVPLYVAERRKRLGAHERDMAAYGSGHAPNPPLLSRASSAGASSASLSSMASSALSSSSSDGSDGSWTGSSEDGDASNGYRPRKRRGGIKGLAALALAGGLAVLLGAKGVDSRATTRHSRREPGRSDAKRRRRAERAARHAAIREE